uniref:Uncharacterized protein n=1 Tax=Rhizophora mucronata TaxID=61149 RepID=A0A2P2L4S7_RHIMU
MPETVAIFLDFLSVSLEFFVFDQ